jgi:hypothetical protein
MRKYTIAALAAAALAGPLAAQNAQAPAAQPAPTPLTTAQVQQLGNTPDARTRGAVILRTFSIAINSDKVQQGIKNQLIGCLYNNPMRNISVATGQAFERNKQLDPKKPEQVYAVAAQICGVKPQAAQAAPAGQTPAQAAAKPAQTSQGR